MGNSAKDNQASLWTEQPVERQGPVASVIPVSALDKVYSYAIPPELDGQVRPGARVIVPFGKKGSLRIGFCVGVSTETWKSTLKPVHEVVDPEPLLSPKLLELGTWIADYYCAPRGRVFEAMLPAAVRRQSGFLRVRRFRITPAAPAADDGVKISPRRRAILERIRAADDGVDLETLQSDKLASPGAIKALKDAGWIMEEIVKVPATAPDFDRPAVEPDITLNEAQAAALAKILSWLEPPRFRVGVLYGVTGSGKTEVYVRAIRKVLDAGGQAILLVPEIALTAQTTHRLASRFRDVVVLHSGLTDSQRSLIWSEISRGLKRVIIGTRSAVFAPCPNLGIIVVDEEQEPSFKNMQSPRFHTRDVAIKRAHLDSIPIVLGSATPSLETWANCSRMEHYECLRLPNRVAGLPMPRVDVVDMRVEHKQREGIHMMSRLMEQLLGETLDRHEQAVLLLNRRGYASYLFCPSCQQRIVCPNCQANMIFHKSTGFAQCHYCRSKLPVPSRCANENCRHKLVRFGMGTQRVEEEMHRLFPDARVERVDTDTMHHAEQYEQIITRFERRELDVLVGTQMIAKGLDFPFVSFVGVISADTAFSIPDFRAAERTFQLVTQVAGRAGRAGTSGRVVVQTFAAEVDALRHATTHDYENFAAGELARRRKLRFPPYGRLIRVVLSDARDSRVHTAAEAMAQYVKDFVARHGLKVECWGPNPCPLARIRNLMRYEVLLRADSASILADAMRRLRNDPAFIPKVHQYTIDVDPVALL